MKRKTAAEDGEEHKNKKHLYILPRLYFYQLYRLVRFKLALVYY